MSKGKVICVVGAMGEGKTTFIKNKFATNKKKTICYLRISDDFNGTNVTTFTNFILFLRDGNKKKNTVCIIDEAYTCLPRELKIKLNKPEDPHNQLADFLVNCRKLNNFIIIILHSLSQIPLWLIPYCDWLIRFNTGEQLQYQINRFQSFPAITSSLINVPTIEKYKPLTIKLR